MKKDLIIGCASNYDYPSVRNWAKSINESGFSGDKVVISYNLTQNCISNLISDGFVVYESSLYMPIVTQRFMDVYRFLKSTNVAYRYVISTDVKDVIFQKNPSEWLSSNLNGKKFVCSSESILYKDEQWAVHNMNESYGQEVFNIMSNKEIFNAGTVAGESEFLSELFLINYLISLSGKSHNPDQASLNILLSTKLFSDSIKYAKSYDGWATQLGTTLSDFIIDKYKTFLLEPAPTIKDDILYNSNGDMFCIVHQYDRVSSLAKKINEKYSR